MTINLLLSLGLLIIMAVMVVFHWDKGPVRFAVYCTFAAAFFMIEPFFQGIVLVSVIWWFTNNEKKLN